jgi:hypothetical protein
VCAGMHVYMCGWACAHTHASMWEYVRAALVCMRVCWCGGGESEGTGLNTHLPRSFPQGGLQKG